ncbi:MAG: MBL fold metallo-hydrolase [Candidatus Methanomethylophilaceae archaeon]
MTVVQLESALLYDANMYVVIGSEKTALIDTGTGFQADASIASLKKVLDGRPLDYVFITHRHYDHVGGLGRIIKEFSPVVFAGEADAVPLRQGDSESTMGTKFGGKIEPMDVTGLKDGEKFQMGGHNLIVIDTPGHTAGSISLYDEITGALFTGDTVFVDGVGRTDTPTGSSAQLIDSLKKLRKVDCKGFYPGHGPALEKDGNEQIERGLRTMGV